MPRPQTPSTCREGSVVGDDVRVAAAVQRVQLRADLLAQLVGLHVKWDHLRQAWSAHLSIMDLKVALSDNVSSIALRRCHSLCFCHCDIRCMYWRTPYGPIK